MAKFVTHDGKELDMTEAVVNQINAVKDACRRHTPEQDEAMRLLQDTLTDLLVNETSVTTGGKVITVACLVATLCGTMESRGGPSLSIGCSMIATMAAQIASLPNIEETKGNA